MNKRQRHTAIIVSCALISLLVSCGGGGGGSNVPFFGGVYDVSMVKVVDDCNVGTASLMTVVNTVNQQERRIVLDSGSVVLTGEVNDKNDGFTASNGYPSDTCSGGRVGTAFVYSPATNSNTDYEVAFAIVSTCGSVSCTVGYVGGAVKR